MRKIACFLIIFWGVASCSPTAAQVQDAKDKTQTAAPYQTLTRIPLPASTFTNTSIPTQHRTTKIPAVESTGESATKAVSPTPPRINSATPSPSATSSTPVLLTYVDGDGGDVFTAEDNMLLSNPPHINLATHDVYDVSTSRKFIQRFNLSAIPAGSTIQSAKIYYYKTSAVPNRNVTCTIFSISQANGDWPEGTKYNRPAEAGDSSWNMKDAAGIPWAGSPGLSTSGTDYEPKPLCSFMIPARAQVGDEFVCDLDIIRVAGWLGTPNTNYGILMVASGNAEYIGSAENPTPGYRPKLVVQYYLNSGPAKTPD